MSDFTVIGLVAMGSAVARALLKAGRSVTVWNRTAEKSQPLIAEGAQATPDLARAIAASGKIIICLPDYVTAADLLDRTATRPLLKGRMVIQLSTATPKEAAAST